AGLWMHVQSDDWAFCPTIFPIVAVREAVRSDVAIRLDFPHDVIPDVQAGEAAAIELLRELAVHLVPRAADAGTQVTLERVDQVGEFLGVVAVLTTAADRQPYRLVVIALGVVATDRTSRRFLALPGMTAARALGHNLGHVITHANA